MIVFNAILRSFVQGYLIFALAIYLNAFSPSFNSSLETNYSILAFLLAFAIMAVPIFLTYFLIKHHLDLPTPKMKNRIGMLYSNLEVDKVIAVMYYPFFLARRFVITLTIVLLKDYPFAQI